MDICLLGPSPGIGIPSYLGNFPVDTSWREEEPVCPIEAERGVAKDQYQLIYGGNSWGYESSVKAKSPRHKNYLNFWF